MTATKHYDECFFLNYNRCTDLSLYEIGIHACPPSYSFGPIVRQHYIFHYLLKGKGTLYLDDKKYFITAHQGFIIPPGVLAYYQADNDDPWDYMWVHLDGAQTTEYFQQAGLTEHNPVITPLIYPNSIESIMKDLLENGKRELYCIGKVFELFDCILELSPAKQEPKTDMKLQYVKTTINFIRIKYNEHIYVGDIARACGLERSYLTRLFKNATGQTPQEYLIAYRIKMARRMLEDESLSIQHIAYAVGYKDSFTFSKAFKRQMNISPSEYRIQKHIHSRQIKRPPS